MGPWETLAAVEHRGRCGPERGHPHIWPKAPGREFLLYEILVRDFGDENGEQPKSFPGLHIRETVSYDRARRKVDPPVLRGPQEERRARFATLAVLLGCVGTVVERVDAGPKPSKPFVQPSMDAMERFLGEEATADSRLIRDTDDEIVVLSEQSKGISRPARELGRFRVR